MVDSRTRTRNAPGPKLRLSHYTTLAGLVGIIETGQIWASNVRYLNDSRELDHGVDASLEAIESLLSQRRALRAWKDALRKVDVSLRSGQLPNTYAACFCEKSDLLSQWRGYGGTEQGVSITFDRRELKRMMGRVKAQYCVVQYRNVTAPSKIKDMLSGELDIYEEIIGIKREGEREGIAYQAICRLIPQFKHLGFKDEGEHRFVIQHNNITEDVCFRPNRNVLVPYLKLLGGDEQLPIESVTIGPGRDPELTARSVQVFLEKHGYLDANVKTSKVPYRT
jgi:hypothetical protein